MTKPIHACADKNTVQREHAHAWCTHTRTSLLLVCNDGRFWNAQMCMQSWSERAACKRRVPVTGRMYSPLPHSRSWSSRWAGRRCCGKERWAWDRCCCCVDQRRRRSSSLAWNKLRLLTVSHHITVCLCRKKYLLCNSAPQMSLLVLISSYTCKCFLMFYYSFGRHSAHKYDACRL